ncbi:MAG TPA: M3 family metallopeptidase [Gemmatimonadaceae bacterium]|nr:M3 family metallopeptidase [Gemmatimonadaceae bacterium]
MSSMTLADRANPLLEKSPLFEQAPPFDRIEDGDYQPAIEEGMRQQLAEFDAIASQSAPPTFENTIAAMERSGAVLTRALKVFTAINHANTNDTLQRVQEIIAPRLAAHHDAFFLDDRLFQRVAALHARRDALGLDPEQHYLVERYYKDFVLAGATLDGADKARLEALNAEEATLSTSFQQKLLAATKAGALVIDDRQQLAGVSDAEIAAVATQGQWALALQNTTQQPTLASLHRRDVRKRLFDASTQRAKHGDANDTRAIITRLATLRAEKAQLLGYSTYATYSLSDEMTKTPERAIQLLADVARPGIAKAKAEQQRMEALAGFPLEPWDWQYYAEVVRKTDYALDEAQIKPYFSLDRVLRDGVFYAAHRLYGLTFAERTDIPVYHPDVLVFEVFDFDGTSLALFYCDFFKRDNKIGGAWMDTFVEQSRLLGAKPVVYNTCNFTKPAPGQPALLTYDNVTTMFHEFGHALHAMFSSVEYPRFSGTATPTDFVELPSQFNEHWALESSVVANYAKHYQTGAPMPPELIDTIKRARTFNQGFAITEVVAAMLLDMAWHSIPAGTTIGDVDAFESAALERHGVAVHAVPPRYHSTYFAHIWSSSYAASYYAYLAAEVLSDDAYAWFVEHGGMTRANGQRFRDMVLSRGGTMDAGDMYRAFRGRDATADALLEVRGLKPSTQP